MNQIITHFTDNCRGRVKKLKLITTIIDKH